MEEIESLFKDSDMNSDNFLDFNEFKSLAKKA
jgi:Ca2+-binding EF-hand superfamily protein